ncbi:hypothetical protein MTO96_034178 [Rhipicephalus appendiculatus]
MPWFDEHHGLHQLRNITDSLGYMNVKILLAVGGYPEDGPYFSVLGHDSPHPQPVHFEHRGRHELLPPGRRLRSLGQPRLYLRGSG